MILLWSLCVCLVLGWLSVRRAASEAAGALWLLLAGARVRVPRRRPAHDRRAAPCSPWLGLPPPRVRARPAAGPRFPGPLAG
jgi:hypothetical protein